MAREVQACVLAGNVLLRASFCSSSSWRTPDALELAASARFRVCTPRGYLGYSQSTGFVPISHLVTT
eukprot:2831856-Prymnesium_polylepis.1